MFLWLLSTAAAVKVGVLLVTHGGFDRFSTQALWDASLQLFSYDPNSFLYKNLIWNPPYWPLLLLSGNAPKEIGKYSFEYKKIGGLDPFTDYTRKQLIQMTQTLQTLSAGSPYTFETDWAGWIMGGDDEAISHYPYPRFIYTSPTNSSFHVNYCGQNEKIPPAPWPNCNPNRYNQDGPAERLLKKGVDVIVFLDTTTTGVRFSKSFDVVEMSKKAIAKWNADHRTNVKTYWANDPTDLMKRAYPTQPPGWTASLGPAISAPDIPLADNPNPVTSDPRLAQLFALSIIEAFNSKVPDEATGVLMLNHDINEYNQVFDPKIDDTIVLNTNIKRALLNKKPKLNSAFVIGAWMGVRVQNPNIPPPNNLERARSMRGEDLGKCWLYKSNQTRPSDEWGYFYWDALTKLVAYGVRHIVVVFPQILTDSVLNLVELHNQVAKEIGYKTWMYWGSRRFDLYPVDGHPFATYWGVWVNTTCRSATNATKYVSCCLTLGGCGDPERPYPPLRQTPPDKLVDDTDAWTAWAVPEYGHVGYDPTRGKPSPTSPVQSQYRGTWALWQPLNDDLAVGTLLGEWVWNATLHIK